MSATLIQVASAVLARLSGAGITTLDQDVATTPAGPYVVVTTDAALAVIDSLAAITRRRLHTITVMAVGGPDGTSSACRDLADRAAALLQGWVPVDGASAFRQAGAGPLLTDGPTGDRRHSLTLIYQTYA